MKVLVVTQYFWPENFRINDVAEGLVAAGHDVTICTGIPNYPKGEFFAGYGWFTNLRQEKNGYRIIRIPLLSRGSAGQIRLVVNYLSFAFFACILAPIKLRGDFDVVLCYQLSPVTVGLPAIVMKLFKKAPLLLWVQDLWPESLSATGAIKSRMALSIVAKLVRFIYSYCDLILVQSQAFLSPVEAMCVPSYKIVYMPNTAEAFYQPLVLRADAQEKKLMPEGFIVMFAGNIGAAQDFESIIDAACLLREETDIKFVVLGDGRALQRAEAKVEELGLDGKVVFLGRYPTEMMPAFLAAADVMLVALRNDPAFSYTIPSKVQSYLACARPIIAALGGEGARIVEESGAGFAVPPGVPAALAVAIKKVRKYLRPLREEMGSNGRKYFETNFSRERLIEKLTEQFIRAKRK